MTEVLRKRPIVCLCGSTRFKEAFERENARLTWLGFIVLSVGLYGHADGLSLTDEAKRALDELHLDKVDLADSIHVINEGGYLGDSTRREIEYARSKDKVVTFMEGEAR